MAALPFRSPKLAYRELRERLVNLGLKVAKKTAFLQPHEPQVATVMRDLGIDHQAARRRRIPVTKQRFAKANQRKLKLRSLKIPSLKVRLRLRRGGIQPVALWGIEAQGLAPRYRTALRAALASQLGHRKGGTLDATYDIHSNKYMDPADQVVIHHIKAMHTLYHAWPTEQISHLEQAWTNIHQLIEQQGPPLVYSQRPTGSYNHLSPGVELAGRPTSPLDQISHGSHD